MNRSVFGASVQGASHKRTGLPCQDNFAIRDYTFSYDRPGIKNGYYAELPKDIKIIAVADGHGSESCPYSKTGSQIAVNVFCDIMAEFCFKFKNDMDSLEMQLKKESDLIHFSQAIEIDWKKRVQSNYAMNKGKRTEVLTAEEEQDEYAICKLYGTTLIGMLLTDEFVFSFQLGDGDIHMVNSNRVEKMLEQEKILGVETHSLSKKSAWTHALTSFHYLTEYQEKPFMFILSTDGMINSYVTEDEFQKSCIGYLNAINDNGVDVVSSNLTRWLDETSEQGCGDDTTVVFAFYS